MAIELTLEERETHLNMTGDNHDEWEMMSDDPFWIRRMEKLGIKPIAQIGTGYKYKLNADQIVVRKGKKQISEQTRHAMAERLRTSRTTGVLAG